MPDVDEFSGVAGGLFYQQIYDVFYTVFPATVDVCV